MESGTLGEALQREHRQIDAGIESFTADGGAARIGAETLRRAVGGLRRHIYLEEEHLFPPLRDAGLVAPVFVMVREHAEMWLTLGALDATLGQDPTPETLLPVCRELMAQLEAHNSKEEGILYPQADRVLDAARAAALRSLLATASMPEGWTCQGMRG